VGGAKRRRVGSTPALLRQWAALHSFTLHRLGSERLPRTVFACVFHLGQRNPMWSDPRVV